MNGEFEKIVNSMKGAAIIMAGSDSDKEHIEKIGKSLERYGIPYDVRICSAHKQPGKLESIIEQLNLTHGSAVIVAVAGGTDALSGTASYLALYPVVSCPPDAPNDSCLRNPPGSSNAYIQNPNNVGRFVAQIYAGINPKVRELLEAEKVSKVGSLNKADLGFQKYKEYK